MEFHKDDKITLKIDDMGMEGEGIGKSNGFTFFVKDAVIGDQIEAKVMKVKKGYAYAKLTKILVPSADRIDPKCPFHKQCGGCQIQALDYKAQLLFKERKIKNNLNRIGGFSQELIEQVTEPIIGMEEPFFYRNKAQFPIGTDKDGNVITGFYAGRTHTIIPNTDCVLGVKENKTILEIILHYMKHYRITPYSEKDGKGLVRHVLIRKGFATGELMVCIVLNGDKLPQMDKLVAELIKVKGMTSISININKDRTNVIMGKVCHTIWGDDTITDVLHVRSIESINSGKDTYCADDNGITFAISPLSFYQVNPVQTEKLYSLALEYAGLTGIETVWDLYCGIGTISLFMAKRARQVYGIEIIEQAVKDARANAERNGIENVSFYTGKAEEVLPRLYKKEGIYADVICVDPPRKGCDAACLETIIKMAAKRIVYISCDSATLARDLKYLCANGYALRRVRSADMFCNTGHVETCVLLSRKNDGNKSTRIEIEIDLDEADRREYIGRATYQEIKDYISQHYQTKVSSLYIAQIKRKLGIIEQKNYNFPKTDNGKVLVCPPEKEEMIKGALKYFGMLDRE